MRKTLKTAAGLLFASVSVLALGACNMSDDEISVSKPTVKENATQIVDNTAIINYINAHNGKNWDDFGYKAYTFIEEEKRNEVRLTKRETIDIDSKSYTLEEYVYEKDASGNYQKKASLKANRFQNDEGAFILTFDISFKDCKIPNTSNIINGELNGYMDKFQPYFDIEEKKEMVIFDTISYKYENVYVIEKESYLYYEDDECTYVYKNDLCDSIYYESESSVIGAKFEYFTTNKASDKISLDGRTILNTYLLIQDYGGRMHLYDDILCEYSDLLGNYFTITEAQTNTDESCH